MATTTHYRLDDLRRLAALLATGRGVAPDRAATLGSLLIWFEALGVEAFGLATLPPLLDQIEAGAVDPRAMGRIVAERSGTAVLDGQRGVPLLVLERAAGIATEKARDVGVGLVRVDNISAPLNASVIAAESAIGPTWTVIIGPGLSWSLALPCAEGPPVVHDPTLVSEFAGRGNRAPAKVSSVPGLVLPWLGVLAPGDGWLVASVAVPAFEPLSAFHERVSASLTDLDSTSAALTPAEVEARRRISREQGVRLATSAAKALKRWAQRQETPFPDPMSRSA